MVEGLDCVVQGYCERCPSWARKRWGSKIPKGTKLYSICPIELTGALFEKGFFESISSVRSYVRPTSGVKLLDSSDKNSLILACGIPDQTQKAGTLLISERTA